MSKIHKLKTWPEYYQAIANDFKRFELRKNDRGFEVGDTLLLKEYEPSTEKYTGEEMYVKVTFIFGDDPDDRAWGLEEGYVIMSIKKLN